VCSYAAGQLRGSWPVQVESTASTPYNFSWAHGFFLSLLLLPIAATNPAQGHQCPLGTAAVLPSCQLLATVLTELCTSAGSAATESFHSPIDYFASAYSLRRAVQAAKTGITCIGELTSSQPTKNHRHTEDQHWNVCVKLHKLWEPRWNSC
jgi:hypothetical protein